MAASVHCYSSCTIQPTNCILLSPDAVWPPDNFQRFPFSGNVSTINEIHPLKLSDEYSSSGIVCFCYECPTPTP